MIVLSVLCGAAVPPRYMQSPSVAELLSSSTAAEAAAAIGLTPLCPLPAVPTPESARLSPRPHSGGPAMAGEPAPVAQPASPLGRALTLALALPADRWALDEGRALADLPPFEGAMLKVLAGGCAVELGAEPCSGSGGGSSGGAASLEACCYLAPEAGERAVCQPRRRA
jgi:hypothetical protein